MPNPRFIGPYNEPTQEMFGIVTKAKGAYMNNLSKFCDKWGYIQKELEGISRVYLIGSHAQESGWMDDKSDVDIKLVLPFALPEASHRYKREVLNPILCPNDVEKRRWIDIFSVREDYQVLPPRFDITSVWDSV